METAAFWISSPVITNHAKKRMAQRNVSRQEIEFVVTHGQRLYGDGAVHYHLRRKDIPQELQNRSNFSRLEGTTVVISTDTGAVITVHRNRAGLRRIRKKS